MSHAPHPTRWSLEDMPNLLGRRALVTGVTSGIGLHTVTELARAGAEVILAARSPEKLARTAEQVRRDAPLAKVSELVCDLADLSSVRRAAKEAEAFGPIGILVNNAGVMATPEHRTADGFDLQFGTNHLGHFALTGLLLEQLADSGDARVVTVSSHMARGVRRVRLDDPRTPMPRYNRWVAYSQSKLANLLFAFELDRRASRAGLPITSVAAHPGYSHTGLTTGGMSMGGRAQFDVHIGEAVTRLVGQSAAMGALPTLMAATAPGLRGSTYVGPGGPLQMRGHPTVVKAPRAAYDEEAAAALWELSERATGVEYL